MAYSKQNVRLGGAYVEITADSHNLYHALKDAETRVKSFTNEFGVIAAGVTSVGAAITVPFRRAAESYAEFEKLMLVTQAVTKSTSSELARLTSQAKELGATTSWTTAKVAEGMVSLGRMGFTNNEIKNTISSVMDLGRALDVDVNVAAKELGAVMRQFGASSRESARYADALATATNSAAIETSELLDTMKYVGAAGRAIGADVETVLALTMALRNAGLTASQAGTQLRTMFLKLQNPKIVNIFKKELGVDVYDANNRLKSFLDIMVEAQDRASVMGDKLAVVARQMFGTLQAPGFITLLQSKDLERFRDELYSASGAAENFRKNMESGVFGALKLGESAIEAIGLQLGETIEPTIKSTVSLIQEASETVRDFVKENGSFVNRIAEAGVKFTALGGAALVATGIVKGFGAMSRAGIGLASGLADAWRKAEKPFFVVENELEKIAVAEQVVAANAPGERLAASMNKAEAAARKATYAVQGLANAEGKAGVSFSVSGASKTPTPRINASDYSTANAPLAAPSYVTQQADARVKAATESADARLAQREAILKARREAHVANNKEYNETMARIHDSRVAVMKGNSPFKQQTLAYLDQEAKSATQRWRSRAFEINKKHAVPSAESINAAFRVDSKRPLSGQAFAVNRGAASGGVVVSASGAKVDAGAFVSQGAASANGTFAASGASFGVNGEGIKNAYGFSVKDSTKYTSTSVNGKTSALAPEVAKRIEGLKKERAFLKDTEASHRSFVDTLRAELKAKQALDPQFVKDVRNNDYYAVEGRTYTRDERRMIKAARKRDLEYQRRIRYRTDLANQRYMEAGNIDEQINELERSASGTTTVDTKTNGPTYAKEVVKRINQQVKLVNKLDRVQEKLKRRWEKSVGTKGEDAAYAKYSAAFDKYEKEYAKYENMRDQRFTTGAGSADGYKVNGKIAQSYNAVASAAKNAGSAVVGAGKSFGLMVANSKAAALGLKTLRFSILQVGNALRMLSGMAVSLLAWEAVAKVFDYIAKKTKEAAENMRQAQDSNEKIISKDEAQAAEAEEQVRSDEELIDMLVEGASSSKQLNAVEKKNLQNIFDNLDNRGIIDGLVVPDSTTPSGYKVVDASAPYRMKANAIKSQMDVLDANADERKLDLHYLDPLAFAKGSKLDSAEVQASIDWGFADDVKKTLDNLTENQKNVLFGNYGIDTWFNDTRLGSELRPYMKGTGGWTLQGWMQGMFNDKSRAVGKDAPQEIFDLFEKRFTKAGIYGQDAINLGRVFMNMLGIDYRTHKYMTDEIDPDVFNAFVDTKGDSIANIVDQLKGFGKADAKYKEFLGLWYAYQQVADENVGKEYSSEEDKKRREILAQSNAEDLAAMRAELDAAIGKSEDKSKTASQRELESLDDQFNAYKERLGAEVDEFGETVFDLGTPQEEKNAYFEEEKKYLARRVELQKQINEELEKEREQETEKFSKEANEKLGSTFGDYLDAVKSGDQKRIADAWKTLEDRRWTATLGGADLSEYYQSSINEIKDTIAQTKTSLETRSTMNAFEFLDMGQDAAIDVQRRQLDEMKRLNSNAREIYNWMTTQEEYKDYI